MVLFRPQPLDDPLTHRNLPTPIPQFNLNSKSPPFSGNTRLLKDVQSAITKIQEKHASIDERLDAEDLLSILRAATHEPDDANIVKLLEIEKPEWPEAIKALRRKLEELRSVPTSDDEKVIHREFVENGIECLRRMSGEDTTLPSWTITKFEVRTCGHVTERF